MNEEARSRCLTHLRAASACFAQTRHSVIAVRLQDLIEMIEHDLPLCDPAIVGCGGHQS